MRLHTDSKLQRVSLWSVVIVVAYTVLPVAGRLLLPEKDIGGVEYGAPGWLVFLGAAWPNCLLIGVILYTSANKGYSVEDWGFTLSRRTLISLVGAALLTATSIHLIVSVPMDLSSLTVLQIIGGFAEELVFRVLLINVLIAFFSSRAGHVHLAIWVSAVVFMAGHIPVEEAPELFGILTGSVLFGYVYVLSRSVLFPIYIHVLSNTLMTSGIIGVVTATLIYLAVSLAGKTLGPRKPRNLAPDGGWQVSSNQEG